MEDRQITSHICYKCNTEMIPNDVVINYMGYRINVMLPRCPKCGQVYLPKDIALGKMVEVEKLLELK